MRLLFVLGAVGVLFCAAAADLEVSGLSVDYSSGFAAYDQMIDAVRAVVGRRKSGNL